MKTVRAFLRVLWAALTILMLNACATTALMDAARSSTDPDAINKLVMKEVEEGRRMAEGPINAALGIAAISNPNPEVIAALLKAGASSEARDRALRLAATFNPNPEVIAVLLKAGAYVNAQDEYGTTALMMAAAFSRPEAVSLLLKAGADANAQDKAGLTALMMAASSNNRYPDVVSALLEAGADINVQSDDVWRPGWTALMYAARYNPNPEIITVLLNAGAFTKAKSDEGKTAFDYAQGNDKLKGTDAYRKLKDALY
jgi:ankyrin repeat protein